MKTRHSTLLATGMLGLAMSAVALEAEDPLFQSHVYSDTMLIEPAASEAFDFDVDLLVSGPNSFHHSEKFSAGSVIEFDPSMLATESLADGVYNYELRIVGTGESIVRGDAEYLHLPSTTSNNLDSPHSGSFTIEDGQFVSPDLQEMDTLTKSSVKDSGSFGLETDDADEGGARDVVYNDDLIVQGSECVGFDCVNGETFGFDTIRLKENNTRLQFDDTSAGSFPTNNWQIRANDSTNGGANYLGIIDQGASGSSQDGTRVFSVTAGAPANSLFVASTGRVGLRTSTPVLDLHINTNNTPGARLEQNSSGGFSAQTWDIAGNEANFFVRDVTGGSRLPFRIRPGAPTSSIDIAANGNVGINNSSPSAPLHVQRNDGTASILVQEDSGTNAVRTLLTLENNGGSRLRFENTANDDHDWLLTANTIGFAISEDFSGVQEFMLEHATGNLTIAGTLTQNSDRDRKTNITPVDSRNILEKVASLPISTWAYREDESVLHLGPMAQDFYASFGLGGSEREIATIDTSGVALAAIQALKAENDAKDAQIASLQNEVASLKHEIQQVSALQARLEKHEQMVAGLLQEQATLEAFDETQLSISE